jgi:hypothetical protein
MSPDHTCLLYVKNSPSTWSCLGPFKGQCHEMDIFLQLETFKSVLSVYALMVFSLCFKNFSLPYTIINFLFDSLKLVSNSENAYWNPSQIPFNRDWSMFSSADLSLAARKMPKNLIVTASQSVSGRILRNPRQLPVRIFSVKSPLYGLWIGL